MLEFFKLNQYLDADYKLSYFSTKEGSEVDLVLTRGRNVIFVEIKSTRQINEIEVHKLKTIGQGNATTCFYLSQCISNQVIQGVRCLYWLDGLKEIFNFNFVMNAINK